MPHRSDLPTMDSKLISQLPYKFGSFGFHLTDIEFFLDSGALVVDLRYINFELPGSFSNANSLGQFQSIFFEIQQYGFYGSF